MHSHRLLRHIAHITTERHIHAVNTCERVLGTANISRIRPSSLALPRCSFGPCSDLRVPRQRQENPVSLKRCQVTRDWVPCVRAQGLALHTRQLRRTAQATSRTRSPRTTSAKGSIGGCLTSSTRPTPVGRKDPLRPPATERPGTSADMAARACDACANTTTQRERDQRPSVTSRAAGASDPAVTLRSRYAADGGQRKQRQTSRPTSV